MSTSSFLNNRMLYQIPENPTRYEYILYKPNPDRPDLWTLRYLQYRSWRSTPWVTRYDGPLWFVTQNLLALQRKNIAGIESHYVLKNS